MVLAGEGFEMYFGSKSGRIDDDWNRYGEGCGFFFRDVKSELCARYPSGDVK